MIGFLKRRLAVLDQMDPKRIYVENVRAFLGVNTKVAAWLCRKACRDGFLVRCFSFEHPQLGHSLLECTDAETIDRSLRIVDETAEALGYPREYELSYLKKVEFFRRAS